MNRNSIIVFVCEHGAAKSILAAAYFNKLAGDLGLNLRAIARGTHPDKELSPIAVSGLHSDGLTPTESAPRKLSLADVESAQQIIAFCQLQVEYHEKSSIDLWDDVPTVSENYEHARDAILERINSLINTLV